MPPTRIAPNRREVVAAVIAAHPEVDSCDEDSLTSGRALLVDWAAQRLNAAEGRVVWGRKSRGRPSADGRADRPNTDALTYLRPDGLFEIYDVVSGGAPCGATWTGYGPIRPGENGYWAPPQLGPESGAPPPPGGGDLAELRQAVETLVGVCEALAETNRDLEARLAASERLVATLAGQVDDLDRTAARRGTPIRLTGKLAWVIAVDGTLP